MLYQHMLEKRGFKVRIARNGKKALELIEAEKPKLVLTDINMPEMSGFELCKLLKSSDTTSDIIVVLLTTTLAPDSIFDCINCGADEISLKGLKEPAFLDLMERSIERRLDFGTEPRSFETRVSLGEETAEIKSGERQAARLLLSLYDLLRKVQEG